MSDNIVKTPSLGARRKERSGIVNVQDYKEVEFGEGLNVEFYEVPQSNPHDLKVPTKSHTVMLVTASGGTAECNGELPDDATFDTLTVNYYATVASGLGVGADVSQFEGQFDGILMMPDFFGGGPVLIVESATDEWAYGIMQGLLVGIDINTDHSMQLSPDSLVFGEAYGQASTSIYGSIDANIVGNLTVSGIIFGDDTTQTTSPIAFLPPTASGVLGEDVGAFSACYFNTSDKKFYKATNNGTLAQARAEYICLGGGAASGIVTDLYRAVNANMAITIDPTLINFPIYLATDGGYTLEAPTTSGTYVKQLGYITSLTSFYFFGMMSVYAN
jgi:hypothetical protein